MKTKACSYIYATTCENCPNTLDNKSSKRIVCGNCGSVYNRKEYSINEEGIVICEYKFKHFGCLANVGLGFCGEPGVDQGLLCEKHCSEEKIEKQKQVIEQKKGDLNREKEYLELMERSRKTMLIMKLGGIDEDNLS